MRNGRPRNSEDKVPCDRCALEFAVATPDQSGTVWVVCPDCGVRFWHAAGAASRGVSIPDVHEGRAHWAAS